ncbi:MAG: TPM domain-containing protein, partial [Clostridia bacterium]|nr:TPM domain-containing protein [Clostridia bacterium]
MKFRRSLRVLMSAALLLALLCAPALAKVVSAGTDFYYLDNANVLSEALEGEIYFSNKLLYEACGAQIVVVTVDSTGRESIDDYAYDLFNDWGIGDASKNNGFLLLLAIGDDDYYALPGSGLNSRFSAGTIKGYYDQYLEDDFAAKNYESGVKKFFEAVFTRISDTYNADVTTAQGVADYRAYVSANSAVENFGGYNGSRRIQADQSGRDDGGYFDFILLILFVVLIITVVSLSKGRRARRTAVIMPPPPPPPMGIGYRPTRTVYHTPYRSSSSWSSGGVGHSSFGSSSGRSSSFGSSSSRSSFGGSSSRSSS